MVSGKSAFSEKKEAPAKKGAAASTPGGSANESPNDSLMLYFQPDQAAVRPIRGYVAPSGRAVFYNDYRPLRDDTCAASVGLMFEPEQLAGKKNSVLLWLRLLDFYRGSQVALSGTTLKTMPD
jgi:hypothetical protein